MPKRKNKNENFNSYYYLNILLISGLVFLRIFDLYLTYMLIEDPRVTETIPLSNFILTSIPPYLNYALNVLLISIPLILLNIHVKESYKSYALLILFFMLVILSIYLLYPISNNLAVLKLVNNN